MSEDKTYNGWTNYETWCANLWLDNDQGSYERWTERAEELVNEHEGDKDEAAITLAEELEADMDEFAPEVHGVYSDLLRASMGEIDWREIAEHFCADVEYESDEVAA